MSPFLGPNRGQNGAFTEPPGPPPLGPYRDLLWVLPGVLFRASTKASYNTKKDPL